MRLLRGLLTPSWALIVPESKVYMGVGGSRLQVMCEKGKDFGVDSIDAYRDSVPVVTLKLMWGEMPIPSI